MWAAGLESLKWIQQLLVEYNDLQTRTKAFLGWETMPLIPLMYKDGWQNLLQEFNHKRCYYNNKYFNTPTERLKRLLLFSKKRATTKSELS